MLWEDRGRKGALSMRIVAWCTTLHEAGTNRIALLRRRLDGYFSGIFAVMSRIRKFVRSWAESCFCIPRPSADGARGEPGPGSDVGEMSLHSIPSQRTAPPQAAACGRTSPPRPSRRIQRVLCSTL